MLKKVTLSGENRDALSGGGNFGLPSDRFGDGADGPTRKPVILLVDDDPLMLQFYGSALEKAGFVVKETQSSVDSITAFIHLKPDLVILDLVMPDLNGFATCRTIRSLPGSEYTPILIITGHGDSRSVKQAFESGATDYIIKPVNLDLFCHRIRYMLGASRDITDKKRSEDSLRLLKEAVERLPIGITISDLEGKIVYANPAEAEMHGYTLQELMSREARMFAPPELSKPMASEKFHKMTVWKRETLNIRKSGEKFPVQLTSIPVKNAQGVPLGIITTCEDITDRKEAEVEIEKLAYHDSLTGLPNRSMFHDRLQKAIAFAGRDGRQVGILFLDLDRFKDINDTQGHEFGDKLLRAVALRLGRSVREADTLARLGGDEFVIVLTGASDREGIITAAERILASFGEPFELDGRQVYSSTSIGVALYPKDGKDVNDLLRSADTAMYHAKAAGRQTYRFFSEEINRKIMEKVHIENGLRRALDRHEFCLYYQPQIDLGSGQIIGAEVLLRWMSPELGMVMPSRFIPVAEDSGLIFRLGEWVLRTACAQAAAWRAAGLSPMRMAINISGHQFKQPSFVSVIDSILRENPIDPTFLEFELTESVIMDKAEKTTSTLKDIKDRGINLSIDDFGTGYSSLSYLKHFPIDRIKIDRSFIADITSNRDEAVIVDTIIAIARSLNLKVVAEGVENREQLDFLRARKCGEAQGYYFAEPMPAASLENWMRYDLL